MDEEILLGHDVRESFQGSDQKNHTLDISVGTAWKMPGIKARSAPLIGKGLSTLVIVFILKLLLYYRLHTIWLLISPPFIWEFISTIPLIASGDIISARVLCSNPY